MHDNLEDLEFMQLDSLSSMLLLDVTLYLHFAERARSLHGKHGRFSQMPQMFSPASAKVETVMEIIEAFVCIMYYQGTDTFAVNKARLELKATVVRCNSSYLRLFNGAYKRSSISGWTCMGSNS